MSQKNMSLCQKEICLYVERISSHPSLLPVTVVAAVGYDDMVGHVYAHQVAGRLQPLR